jgi:hypothetical protein
MASKASGGNFRPNASDIRFLVGAAIVAVVAIVLSLTLGVGIDPDLSMIAAPYP